MRDLAIKASAKVHDSETPMVAHYQLLAGHLRRIPHLQPGRLWEIRNNGLSMQVFMLEEEGWFLVYKQLPEPAHEYTTYTDGDAELLATGNYGISDQSGLEVPRSLEGSEMGKIGECRRRGRPEMARGPYSAFGRLRP